MTRQASAAALCAVVLALAPLGAGAFSQGAARRPPSAASGQEKTMQHPYIGMWVTADGQIRQALLPNGRYDEARGARKSAYRGRYEVNGTHIEYWDDTGFTADGDFVSDDVLHHGGMVFHRERS